jgi:lysophospholipase L1-like esterase
MSVENGGANCSNTTVGMTPLIDMGVETYHGYSGGLYPGCMNCPPTAYTEAGLARAQQVVPRDRQGRADPNGTIAMCAIGMSNGSMEIAGFRDHFHHGINPRLAVVDCAQLYQTASVISDANSNYWSVVGQRLAEAGVSKHQVQVVWVKEANARVREPFPEHAEILSDNLRSIVKILAERYPNLHLIYISSRIYAGYASIPLSPEPYAYEGGFAVKWMIEGQIQETLDLNTSLESKHRVPWIGWGPYLWTDGLKGRSDGLVWECSDVESDGTHPSISGRRKVGRLLLEFFETEPTAKTWFLSGSEEER